MFHGSQEPHFIMQGFNFFGQKYHPKPRSLRCLFRASPTLGRKTVRTSITYTETIKQSNAMMMVHTDVHTDGDERKCSGPRYLRASHIRMPYENVAVQYLKHVCRICQ